MPDKPFVINDRRKFTAEGDVRPGVEIRPAEEKPAPESEVESSARLIDTPAPAPQSNLTEMPSRHPEPAAEAPTDDQMPPPPTAEQMAQAKRAYDATVERLDVAMRSANPGGERIPDLTFTSFVQSLYMQAILQLGGGTEPGQQPRVDPIGARQTIDMLGIVAAKTAANLDPNEAALLDSALFEAQMAFLEVTQALARQAAAHQAASGPLPPPPGGGPSIVR